jgi:hypothetical protein
LRIRSEQRFETRDDFSIAKSNLYMAIHLHHVRTLVIRDLPPGEVCMAFDPGPQSEEGATHPELLSSLEAIVFLPGDRSDFQDRRLRPGGQFAPRKDQTAWESLICGVERMIPGDRQIHLCYSKTWSHPSALEFDDPNPIPILTNLTQLRSAYEVCMDTFWSFRIASITFHDLTSDHPLPGRPPIIPSCRFIYARPSSGTSVGAAKQRRRRESDNCCAQNRRS